MAEVIREKAQPRDLRYHACDPASPAPRGRSIAPPRYPIGVASPVANEPYSVAAITRSRRDTPYAIARSCRVAGGTRCSFIPERRTSLSMTPRAIRIGHGAIRRDNLLGRRPGQDESGRPPSGGSHRRGRSPQDLLVVHVEPLDASFPRPRSLPDEPRPMPTANRDVRWYPTERRAARVQVRLNNNESGGVEGADIGQAVAMQRREVGWTCRCQLAANRLLSAHCSPAVGQYLTILHHDRQPVARPTAIPRTSPSSLLVGALLSIRTAASKRAGLSASGACSDARRGSRRDILRTAGGPNGVSRAICASASGVM